MADNRCAHHRTSTNRRVWSSSGHALPTQRPPTTNGWFIRADLSRFCVYHSKATIAASGLHTVSTTRDRRTTEGWSVQALMVSARASPGGNNHSVKSRCKTHTPRVATAEPQPQAYTENNVRASPEGDNRGRGGSTKQALPAPRSPNTIYVFGTGNKEHINARITRRHQPQQNRLYKKNTPCTTIAKHYLCVCRQ